jgi:hypothetical protein
VNRAERRRAAHPRRGDGQRALFSIALVRYADRNKMIAAALAGDAAEAAKLSIISNWMASYQRDRTATASCAVIVFDPFLWQCSWCCG